MARRVVQECDLTKAEYDPADTVTLVIKKNGKKTGRTYELSPEAAARLEQQLVSGNKLSPEWGFVAGTAQTIDATPKRGRTLGDLEDELEEDERQHDAAFVADKKADMRAESHEESEPAAIPELGADDSGCLHMNKGPVTATQRNGRRFIYRVCRECRRRIPVKPKEDRKAFLDAKAPSETRVNHDPRIKEREES